MTDCRKVFVDTAPFIYYIEKDENNPLNFEKVKRFLRELTCITVDDLE